MPTMPTRPTFDVRVEPTPRAEANGKDVDRLGNALSVTTASVAVNALRVRASASGGWVRVEARTGDDFGDWDAKEWVERAVGMRNVLRCSSGTETRAFAVEIEPEREAGENAERCAEKVADAARAFAASSFVMEDHNDGDDVDMGF